MGMSIEELREYCEQLCNEGKGGDSVQIAGSGVGSCDVASPYNNKLEWWESTSLGYEDGALRILAEDVYFDKVISKETVKGMVEDIDTALDDLRNGDIRSLEANIGVVQYGIDSLLAEVS